MKHISITRKIVSGVAMVALLLTGGLIGQSTSQAAGLPTVRVVSPDFNSANEMTHIRIVNFLLQISDQ